MGNKYSKEKTKIYTNAQLASFNTVAAPPVRSNCRFEIHLLQHVSTLTSSICVNISNEPSEIVMAMYVFKNNFKMYRFYSILNTFYKIIFMVWLLFMAGGSMIPCNQIFLKSSISICG